MQVTSGARWSTTVGMREWSVSLNEDDGAELFSSKWAELKWTEKLSLLRKRADLLVIQYMLENDAITEDFAKQRVAEITNV